MGKTVTGKKPNSNTKQIYQKTGFVFSRQCLTDCVTCGWAGVDNVREQDCRVAACSGVDKARKWRRIPPVKCTLCWGALRKTRRLKTRTTPIKLTRLLHELYSLARTKNFGLSKHLLKNIVTLFAPSCLLKKDKLYFDQDDY